MTHNVRSVFKKVEQRGPNDCWPWLGYKNTGYGRIDIDGAKGVYAHRVAYAATHPEFDLADNSDGNLVLHTCDNRGCCNPNHLYVGTHEKNAADKVARNRLPDYSGDKGPNCKLTLEEVDFIRLQQKYGATLKALALLYDVSLATIKGCIYGRHYKEAA